MPDRKPAARKPIGRKAKLKTTFTGASVDAFLDRVEPDQRRLDARAVLALMQRITGAPPRMLGPTIIAFGHSVLTYPDGRTLDWCQVAFSPRKANLVIYLREGFTECEALLEKLGKHKSGKVCLYVNRLADVDLAALEALIRESAAWVAKSRGA